MRDVRQAAIREIVAAGGVATQAALRAALRRRGLRVDQSTLSRDLAELNVRKRGGVYVLPPAETPRPAEPDLRGAVRALHVCGPHLIVVHTTIGQAQPVAVAIDARQDPAILATLAGDDTIFVATRNRRSQALALRRLETWFGGKREEK